MYLFLHFLYQILSLSPSFITLYFLLHSSLVLCFLIFQVRSFDSPFELFIIFISLFSSWSRNFLSLFPLSYDLFTSLTVPLPYLLYLSFLHHVGILLLRNSFVFYFFIFLSLYFFFRVLTIAYPFCISLSQIGIFFISSSFPSFILSSHPFLPWSSLPTQSSRLLFPPLLRQWPVMPYLRLLCLSEVVWQRIV